MTTDNRSKKIGHKKEAFAVFFILIVVLSLLYYGNPSVLPFMSFRDSDVLSIITSLFVMAIFMERSVQAILIPVRTPDRKKIEQALMALKQEVQEDASKLSQLVVKEQELANYRLETAKCALWISFLFGLIISLVGVRTLAGLVDVASLADSDIHRTMFSFVDIVLTGGVIAGGSAAIDKIGRKISENMKLTSAADLDSDAAPVKKQ